MAAPFAFSVPEEKPKVTELKVVPPPKPDEDMLRMLDDFRERVTKGELNFLGIVASYHDGGAVTNGWVARKTAQRFTVLGAITEMQIKYHNSNCQDD